LVTDAVLAGLVTEYLAEWKYSPQSISKRLAGEGHRISHETIYLACYRSGWGLGDDAWKHLSGGYRPRRRARGTPKSTAPSPLGQLTLIKHRPPIVEGRTQVGHWEGDLITGAGNRSAMITLTERVTRHTMLGALPGGYRADLVADTLIALFRRVPAHLRLTLTWDQGNEMARWRRTASELGLEIYFCNPHSPWQKGGVENTNKILRRWFPKSTPLNTHTQHHVDHIAHRLNTMPRRLHQWRTATDLYNPLAVATTP
jgi:IS30 family transposase